MPNDPRRVLITGIGLVTPFGRGIAPLWQALIDGRAAPGQRFDSYDGPPNLDPAVRLLLGRCSLLAAGAAIEAVEDAAMPFTAQTAPLIGVAIGSELGEPDKPLAGAPATSTARVLGVAGPVLSLSGKGSGLSAVLQAYEMVKQGTAPVVVAGGVDLLPAETADPGPARPFEANRTLPRPAEAACLLVLEDAEIAAGRDARVYGEVLGGGAAFSRATVMQPALNFVDAARSMRAALLRAEVFQGEIEAIFAAANGDHAGDEVECRAISDFWGPNADRLTVTSIHGASGSAGASSGPMSVAVALHSINKAIVPAVTGCHRPADAFSALDIVTGAARPWRFNTALINDFSDGCNVSLVVRRTE